MTVKIEYPAKGKRPFKSELITGVIKIESAGQLRGTEHGIDINAIIIETRTGIHRSDFRDIQHFEILP